MIEIIKEEALLQLIGHFCRLGQLLEGCDQLRNQLIGRLVFPHLQPQQLLQALALVLIIWSSFIIFRTYCIGRGVLVAAADFATASGLRRQQMPTLLLHPVTLQKQNGRTNGLLLELLHLHYGSFAGQPRKARSRRFHTHYRRIAYLGDVHRFQRSKAQGELDLGVLVHALGQFELSRNGLVTPWQSYENYSHY